MMVCVFIVDDGGLMISPWGCSVGVLDHRYCIAAWLSVFLISFDHFVIQPDGFWDPFLLMWFFECQSGSFSKSGETTSSKEFL